MEILPTQWQSGLGAAQGAGLRVPQEVFLALPFNEKVPQGIVVFHEAFRQLTATSRNCSEGQIFPKNE